MQTRWKTLVKNIPIKIKVGPKIHYEILWVDDFASGDLRGEMRPDTRQIVIQRGLSDKETVTTFFHEWLHAMSDENGVKLTENQVIEMEKRFRDFQTFFELFN